MSPFSLRPRKNPTFLTIEPKRGSPVAMTLSATMSGPVKIPRRPSRVSAPKTTMPASLIAGKSTNWRMATCQTARGLRNRGDRATVTGVDAGHGCSTRVEGNGTRSVDRRGIGEESEETRAVCNCCDGPAGGNGVNALYTGVCFSVKGYRPAVINRRGST